MIKEVNIIGGGLAGCESAYQLLKRGVTVNLFEMKPNKYSPAHHSTYLAELVCSNSLKSNDVLTAGGLLKEELRKLDSLLIKCADACKVPAGSALAVDREAFSKMVTEKLKEFPNLNIIYEEVETIDTLLPTIIATGPLTSESFADFIGKLIGGEKLYFFDAIAPIIAYDSIDFNSAFIQDRYNKGTGDYINCPMNKEEYDTFYQALVSGETVKLKDFENSKVFEGCMPIEVLAKRGYDAIRFGALKPVGLTDKKGKMPYAVVQLRRESKENDFYNMVGFQTNLTFKEQKRIFSMIPSLKNAEFLRYGTMHKNTYINAPLCLNKFYQLKKHPNIFIAGQISGVEGYIESISSGLLSALNMYLHLKGNNMLDFTNNTIIGALQNYITSASPENFQPMSANMGLLSKGDIKIKDKKEKNRYLYEKSMKKMEEIILNLK